MLRNTAVNQFEPQELSHLSAVLPVEVRSVAVSFISLLSNDYLRAIDDPEC